MIEIPALRINDCGLADYPSGGVLGPRTMPDYEIVWIERGECRWEFDGTSDACPPGSVLMCTPGLRDTWYWDPAAMTRHGYIHFEFLDDTELAFPRRRDCRGSDVLRPLLRHTIWLAGLGNEQTDAHAATALRQALGWYLAGFVAPADSPTEREFHPVLTRALRALHDSWGDGHKTPPPVRQWAVDSGVSRGHLARICRSELGITPRQLLLYLRLDFSLGWLSRTNLKISQISEMSGFQNQFHFSRSFKQTYGASPREMRKHLREGGGKPLSTVVGMRRMTQFVG